MVLVLDIGVEYWGIVVPMVLKQSEYLNSFA